MKRKVYTVFIIIAALACLAACSVTKDNSQGIADENENESPKQDALQGMTKENIWYLAAEHYDADMDAGKIIELDFDEKSIVIDGEETALTEEACLKLSGLIFDYSYQVQSGEYDYWPHTEEYPEMVCLFSYRVYYGSEKYKADGALCYPDGWEEFLKTLESYGK